MTDISSQPGKQRKNNREASLHRKSKKIRSTLSDELREEYGARRVRVIVGDDVEVMRGDFAGESGEVLDVELDEGTVEIEGVTIEATDGEEVLRPIDASNVRVTDLNLSDRERRDKLDELGGDEQETGGEDE